MLGSDISDINVLYKRLLKQLCKRIVTKYKRILSKLKPERFGNTGVWVYWILKRPVQYKLACLKLYF